MVTPGPERAAFEADILVPGAPGVHGRKNRRGERWLPGGKLRQA